jgi:hypothetical protein
LHQDVDLVGQPRASSGANLIHVSLQAILNIGHADTKHDQNMCYGQLRDHSLQLGVLLHNTLQWTPCGSQLHGRYALVGVMHQKKGIRRGKLCTPRKEVLPFAAQHCPNSFLIITTM